MNVALTVNGRDHAVAVEPRKSLLDCLREDLRLTGTHAGCEHGVCGACTVLLDGEPVRSCLIFAVQADGYAITTIEGLAPAPGELGIVQDAFCETHGLQCGYCTPGMILAASALLERNGSPTRHDIVDAISGNICRCTGYGQIVEAIELAAERLRGRNLPKETSQASEDLAGTASFQPPHAEVAAAGGPRSPHGGGSFEAPLRGAPQDEEGGRPSPRSGTDAVGKGAGLVAAPPGEPAGGQR